jgi:hypothetical protein
MDSRKCPIDGEALRHNCVHAQCEHNSHQGCTLAQATPTPLPEEVECVRVFRQRIESHHQHNDSTITIGLGNGRDLLRHLSAQTRRVAEMEDAVRDRAPICKGCKVFAAAERKGLIARAEAAEAKLKKLENRMFDIGDGVSISHDFVEAAFAEVKAKLQRIMEWAKRDAPCLLCEHRDDLCVWRDCKGANWTPPKAWKGK